MNESFDFAQADHFTVGAVGEPGHRLFLMQAQSGDELVTIKVEKQQVAALATYIAELLADLPSPGHLPDNLDLREPTDPVWAAGSLAATYDDDLDRIVVYVQEFEQTPSIEDVVAEAAFIDAPTDADAVPATARFRITREQGAAVAIHGITIVEAGRPPCPLCGHPLDPSGHACPRTNGHRPPAL